MKKVSVFRLNLLRAGYSLLAIGLSVAIWPEILDPLTRWDKMRSVVVCMLGAMSILAVIGLRHPLRMLPLLFFELAWKTFWLVRIAVPLWLHDRMDASYAETAVECLMAVLFVCVIPWDHVFAKYVKGRGGSWRSFPASGAG